MAATEIKLAVPAERRDTHMCKGPRKWVKAHEVTVGAIKVEATSLAAAKEQAVKVLTELAEIADERPMFIGRNGITMCVYPTVGSEGVSWGYSIIEDARSCGSASGAGGKDENVARAIAHLVQMTTEFLDDESLTDACRWLDGMRHRWERAARHGYTEPEDLIRTQLEYAGWQRAYRDAEAKGETDPHRWASDHARQFIPTIDWQPKEEPAA